MIKYNLLLIIHWVHTPSLTLTLSHSPSDFFLPPFHPLSLFIKIGHIVCYHFFPIRTEFISILMSIMMEVTFKRLHPMMSLFLSFSVCLSLSVSVSLLLSLSVSVSLFLPLSLCFSLSLFLSLSLCLSLYLSLSFSTSLSLSLFISLSLFLSLFRSHSLCLSLFRSNSFLFSIAVMIVSVFMHPLSYPLFSFHEPFLTFPFLKSVLLFAVRRWGFYGIFQQI